MKKIKNKFIIFIIAVLITIVSYIGLQNTNEKFNNSTVVLREGKAHIMRNSKIITLDIQKKYIVKIGDTISTLTPKSLLIVTWGDGSLTRLGGDSSIQIKEAKVSENLSEIKINFKLLAGKTWSNVTSFLGDKSYFLETFNDHEATVRGTVFDIDLDKKYVYVASHKIDLKKKGKKGIQIGENKPFSLETFSFISLTNFIKNIKDIEWEQINKKLDTLQFKKLQSIMLKKLEATGEFLQLQKIKEKTDIKSYISELNIEEKKKLYNNLLKEYQNIHFANAKSPELLSKKLEIKEALILSATDTNKQYLIESTLYDIKEVIKTNNALQFKKLLDIFIENKNILDNLNIKLPEIISFKNLSDEFNIVIFTQLDNLKNIFINTNFSQIPNISGETLQKLYKSGDENIKSFLNNTLNNNFLGDLNNKAQGTINETLNTLFKK